MCALCDISVAAIDNSVIIYESETQCFQMLNDILEIACCNEMVFSWFWRRSSRFDRRPCCETDLKKRLPYIYTVLYIEQKLNAQWLSWPEGTATTVHNNNGLKWSLYSFSCDYPRSIDSDSTNDVAGCVCAERTTRSIHPASTCPGLGRWRPIRRRGWRLWQ